MNIALNPEATADKSCETYRKTIRPIRGRDPHAFPEAARELAETSVAQTVEAYERSKNALEAAVDTMARSFDALGQGAAALNRKIIEIAQQNVSSGFDLAKGLATAKTLAEIVELRAAYWRKQFSALAAQAEEVRALSTKVAAEMAAPIKAHGTSIHIAGGFAMAPVAKTSKRDLMQLIDINLVSCFLCCSAAVNVISRSGQGGRIVNVAARHALEWRGGAGHSRLYGKQGRRRRADRGALRGGRQGGYPRQCSGAFHHGHAGE